MPDLTPGDPVRVEFTKWGDRPHWRFDGVWLGADGHGDWIGYPRGTAMSRPGMAVTSTNQQVGLVPRTDLLTGAWVGTLHGAGGSVHTYVDMSTRPVWDLAGAVPVVRAVDLDLDVIRTLDGRAAVDDEDEFAAHRVAYGYPADVAALAEASCAAVLDAVRRGTPPFDDTTRDAWLDVLDSLGRATGPG